MEKLPSSVGVLEGLLRYNGFRYRADGARFHLVFRDRGCKWESTFVCLEGAVLIYGRYPFPAVDETRALQMCEKVNREVLYGGMFLSEGHLIYRTCADLYDAYLSYEQLGRAMEYNAGVIRRYWEEARLCAGAEGKVRRAGPVSSG